MTGIIAILGVDGSGKSSHAAELTRRLTARGVSVLAIHHNYPFIEWLRKVLRRDSHGGPPRRTSDAPTESFGMRVAGPPIAFMDALVARVKLRRQGSGTGIIVCDRYAFDHLANYLSRARWSPWAFVRVARRPLAVVLVDVPAAVAYSRRAEGSPEFCARNVERFRSIAGRDLRAPFLRVDNTRAFDDVAGEIEAFVLKVIADDG